MAESTDPDRVHPAVRRLRADPAVAAALDTLAGLDRGDLTTVLLEVLSERTRQLSAADVRRLHTADRFVRPSTVDAVRLAHLRASGLRLLTDRYEPVELAPLAPMGAHTAFARVDPRNVVSTERQAEVAADPTNQLALVAADRMRAGDGSVRLTAAQKVTRAQRFDGPMSFPHFSLLGVVVASRSKRTATNDRMRTAEVALDLAATAAELSECPVRLGWLDSTGSEPPEPLLAGIETLPDVGLDPGSAPSGSSYYRGLRFSLTLVTPDGPVGIGDGGPVDWMTHLSADRTACLSTGAISLDRLALV